MSNVSEAVKFLNIARANELPFASRARPVGYDGINNEGRKIYRVQGSNFIVEKHYTVLSWIGYGAYGIVCAAVDLRLDADSDFYDEDALRCEQEAQYLLEDPLTGARYTPKRLPARRTDPTTVATLRYEPFRRRELPTTGTVSPFVAIKKIPRVLDDLVDGRRILREVKALQYLCGHPNIIRLLDLYCCGGDTPEQWRDLYMVTELLDTDLYAFIKGGHRLEDDQFTYITYQVLKALFFIHSSGFIHRDVKPNNILLNSDCHVKLCDFGLTRGGIPLDGPHPAADKSADAELDEFAGYGFASMPHPPPRAAPDAESPKMYGLTDYVVTRYYRAPELLVMGKYNHGVDVWATGCILAEILLRRPLFAGSNYLSQLTLIMETPDLPGMPSTAAEVDEMFEGGHEGKVFMANLLPRAGQQQQQQQSPFQPSQQYPSGASRILGGARHPPGALALILRMLTVDPRKRPTARDLLRDPFFRQVYSPADEITVSASGYADFLTPVPPNKPVPRAVRRVLPLDAAPSWGVDHKVLQESNLRRVLDDLRSLFTSPAPNTQ